MGIGDFLNKGKKAVEDKVSGVKQGAQQKLLESQLKKIPEPQRSALINSIQEDPDFWKNIETEIQKEMKEGKSQMAAAMSVMRKYQGDIQKKLMNSGK